MSTRVLIQRASPLMFENYPGKPNKWAIYIPYSRGREEFGRYPTKAAAQADARRFDLKVVNP